MAGAAGYQVNGGALSGWTTLGDVATYTFTGLTANTQYTLQARALDRGVPSAASPATAKTLPNAPTSPTTSEITVNSIKLSWTASVGGADSYEVSSDGTTWVDSGSDTEHVFTGLMPSTAYTLQVRAKNVSGVSAAVSAASATTLTPSATPTNTPTPTPTFTPSDTPTGTPPPTSTATPTLTPSDTPTPTFTPSDTPTGAIVPSDTPTPTLTPSYTPTGQQAPPGPARRVSRERRRPTPTLSPTPTLTPTPIFSTCRFLPASIRVSGFHEVTQCQQVDHRGVGIWEVIRAGVIDAVDVWAYVPPNLEVCFRNQGSLIFLDAANAPKFPEPLPYYLRGEMTCATINRTGTLVLLRAPLFPGGPIAAPVPSPAAPPLITPVPPPPPTRRLENCIVTLQNILNFRDAPAGNIMDVLPAWVSLTALEKTDRWFKVDFYGRRGWISADYVQPHGDC